MLDDTRKVISVDDHIIEPPNLWSDRLPAAYRDQGPNLVHKEDGDYWLYAGELVPHRRLSCIAGTDPSEWTKTNLTYAETQPAVYDPAHRLDAMDADGIWASLCFPNYPRFSGHRFLSGDRDVALLCVKAWNDFVLDEWCAADPERFIPLSILPYWDVDLAIEEVGRVAAKGSRAIAFTENPTILGLPSVFTGHWTRLAAAIADADMVLCMHIGSSSRLLKSSDDAPDPTWASLVGTNAMFAAVDWVFSGMLQQIPTLRIALSEGGAGWAPYVLERIDYVWETRRFYAGLDQMERPSDLFRKHFGLCFLKDDVAIRHRHEIGIETLMFESDFPHADSIFPHSRKTLANALADVPDDEVELIVEGNARRFFRFPG